MSLPNERTHHHLGSCKGIKHERLDAAAGAGNGEEAERAEDALLETTAPGPAPQDGQCKGKKGGEETFKLRNSENISTFKKWAVLNYGVYGCTRR